MEPNRVRSAIDEIIDVLAAIDCCLSPYLLVHEEDIFLDINDFGDLAEVFELVIGRKPGEE